MSEAHFDQFEHYNFDQDQTMFCGRSGECVVSSVLHEE